MLALRQQNTADNSDHGYLANDQCLISVLVGEGFTAVGALRHELPIRNAC